jgi:nitric oxide dioxygenase
MISDPSRTVVAATLPVVAEHIQQIAERFYQQLFAAHPELLDGTFNRGNQVDGSQQRALAGSVAIFATALVNTPDRLPEHLMSRIAHKHASLGIRPEQYRVVHEHLMSAIGDVLGDAVTPAVATAWDEVYWLMANALINQERGLYGARGVTAQTVWREWEVEQKVRETDDVVTFVVRRVDDRLVKTSLPGQYVTVLIPMPDGVRQPRQYSLTRADDGRHRQFSVKWVHGDVVLDDAGRPVVFASAGIGITPMAGMLSHLVTAGSHLRIMLLHADLDEGSFALRRQVLDDIGALPNASVHVWYEKPADATAGAFAGTMDLGQVDLPADGVYYLCGPLPFMQAVRSRLIEREVRPQDIRYEVFGPDLWQADLE